VQRVFHFVSTSTVETKPNEKQSVQSLQKMAHYRTGAIFCQVKI
jgi:hypothetical protein